MHCFITGCAGFIGSNLTDRLLALGHTVVGYDNLSTGQTAFLQNASLKASFRFVEGDLLDLDRLATAMKSSEIVFHLAANADVRFGTEHPTKKRKSFLLLSTLLSLSRRLFMVPLNWQQKVS